MGDRGVENWWGKYITHFNGSRFKCAFLYMTKKKIGQPEQARELVEDNMNV